MYYILYLASLCRRRHWQEPSYEAYTAQTGFTCTVRVNNREYQTESVCASEALAQESAAMRAYLICRNFSVNDGMIPAGHARAHGGAVQGIPVAIGTGRKTRDDDDTEGSTSSGGSWSGGSSPERMMRLDRELHLGMGGGPGTDSSSGSGSEGGTRPASLVGMIDYAREM
ncbi:uncharacterized protein N7503_008311 [Penicillium pulvis]|uniref:uncharacterized protein n=1 Tax=Penicillium pulvis TaxID=1562058 RepID=UPI002548AF20|nr:uncharacterized protein N7503_008311 [Penicillium pulvis]KAJ5792333.1 hypothetical protein N7503_008311 [Penicillium pulvis]